MTIVYLIIHLVTVYCEISPMIFNITVIIVINYFFAHNSVGITKKKTLYFPLGEYSGI